MDTVKCTKCGTNAFADEVVQVVIHLHGKLVWDIVCGCGRVVPDPLHYVESTRVADLNTFKDGWPLLRKQIINKRRWVTIRNAFTMWGWLLMVAALGFALGKWLS